jgi:hypothetical protein
VFSKFRFKTKGFGHEGGIDEFRSVLYYFPTDKVAVALGKNYDNNDIIVAALSSYFNKPLIPTFTAITLPPKNSTLFGQYSTAGFNKNYSQGHHFLRKLQGNQHFR